MHEQFIGTRPVEPRHQFNTEQLADYLKKHVENFAGNLEVQQFKGGQSNPTYLISAGNKKFVLRRKPPGKLLPSAHAVDREYRITTALATSGVPVARSYVLCQDENVIGTPFYVMDFVDGRIIWDPAMQGASNAERAAVYDELNRVMATLHEVDYAALGLSDFGKPGSYLERQIARWSKQYRASETEKIEAMDRLIDWLPQNIPPGDETSIVHGDYRLDNVIFHRSEPRILAVIDWELSTLGHPLADFAYHCMAWRLRPSEFRGLVGYDLAGLGIPVEERYVARYCERVGRREIAHWDFYMAYNMFRFAGILQGIMRRVLDGTAASQHAEEQGKLARPLAEAGWRQVQKMSKRTPSGGDAAYAVSTP